MIADHIDEVYAFGILVFCGFLCGCNWGGSCWRVAMAEGSHVVVGLVCIWQDKLHMAQV